MIVAEDALVFDTGPLRHFATQGWLGVLRFLAAGRPIYLPESVERELNDAIAHVPAVRTILDADWIKVHRTTDAEFSKVFAAYHSRLVVGTKNRGECGVLAMGEVYKCEIVLDDSTPRAIAQEKGLKVTATVPILCDAIRAGKLTTVMVEALADALLESEYYLPFGPGGFRRHVLENGLLDYEDL